MHCIFALFVPLWSTPLMQFGSQMNWFGCFCLLFSITESITHVWRSQQSCNRRKIHARRHTSHINRWQRHKCYAMDCFINFCFLWNKNQFCFVFLNWRKKMRPFIHRNSNNIHLTYTDTLLHAPLYCMKYNMKRLIYFFKKQKENPLWN